MNMYAKLVAIPSICHPSTIEARSLIDLQTLFQYLSQREDLFPEALSQLELLKGLLNPSDPAKAITTISIFTNKQLIDLLTKLFRAEYLKPGHLAGYGVLGNKLYIRSEEELLANYNEETLDVLSGIAKIFGQLRMIKELMNMTNTPDPWIRIRVLEQLIMIGEKEKSSELALILKKKFLGNYESCFIRSNIADCLQSLGYYKEALELYSDCYGDYSQEYRMDDFIKNWDILKQLVAGTLANPEETTMPDANKILLDIDEVMLVEIFARAGLIPQVNTITKCIVVDCDGTLWKGAIGEEGISGVHVTEQHKEFQQQLKILKSQGILLAINSKNELANVLLVLNNHPDMLLRESDFANIKANWDNKGENITTIAHELNISPTNMVFIDNSSHERIAVRHVTPSVTVPEVSDDPSSLIRALASAVVTTGDPVTQEDMARTELYQSRDRREKLREQLSDQSDYLYALEMNLAIHEADDSYDRKARIAQLSQRTNQFNVTGIRYSEADITDILNNKDYKVLAVNYSDCFDDNGIVAAVILKKTQSPDIWEIDSFYVSCRAAHLTIEAAILGYISYKHKDIRVLIGTYKDTGRNAPARDVYKNLGFQKVNSDEQSSRWENDIASNPLTIPPWITIQGINDQSSNGDKNLPQVLLDFVRQHPPISEYKRCDDVWSFDTSRNILLQRQEFDIYGYSSNMRSMQDVHIVYYEKKTLWEHGIRASAADVVRAWKQK
ncbi:MAG TPA: hypothetical protein DCS13_12325 [Candidatus Margulisbacteria bacterium]|nr:MAG: hypothetical protein A2X43_08915 [Candidatus Margulisbacteria bacterium GWD2_39_127]HAR64244.1 hypothetical protein [Candidatus Margulisiibacteriota bacterium]